MQYSFAKVMSKIKLENLVFNENGLIPVVAQQYNTKQVLMLAYMNKLAIEKTLETGYVHYWSRSRNSLWKKGETSGCLQKLIELKIDCDFDTILVLVDQTGPACHTGKENCFFNKIIR